MIVWDLGVIFRPYLLAKTIINNATKEKKFTVIATVTITFILY